MVRVEDSTALVTFYYNIRYNIGIKIGLDINEQKEKNISKNFFFIFSSQISIKINSIIFFVSCLFNLSFAGHPLITCDS